VPSLRDVIVSVPCSKANVIKNVINKVFNGFKVVIVERCNDLDDDSVYYITRAGVYLHPEDALASLQALREVAPRH
jgi:hypothetical protein